MGKQCSDLWASDCPVEWRSNLDGYDESVLALAEAKGKPDFVQLDKWYQEELPLAVAQRAPEKHITSTELSDIMRWKLSRGKFRPGLQNKADSNSNAVCKTATAKGFRAAEQVDAMISEDRSRDDKGVHAATIKAIEALSKGPPKLAGIGPATASAILAAGCGSFPFMSDEATMAVLPSSGKLQYNLKEYTDFCSLLRAKASALNAAAQGKPVAKPWTASMVEKALWSAAAREAFRSGKSSARKVEQGLDENRKRRKKQ